MGYSSHHYTNQNKNKHCVAICTDIQSGSFLWVNVITYIVHSAMCFLHTRKLQQFCYCNPFVRVFFAIGLFYARVAAVHVSGSVTYVLTSLPTSSKPETRGGWHVYLRLLVLKFRHDFFWQYANIWQIIANFRTRFSHIWGDLLSWQSPLFPSVP